MTAAKRLIRLEEVATFLGGSTPLRVQPEYFGGGIPWVKTTDLNNGLINATEETLTALGLKESSCKMVPANAVLVAMYGGFNQIGRTGLLLKDSAINQALTAIIPEPSKLDPSFLLEWLNYRVDYWKRFAGSSRKDPNITKGDVADFPVPNIPVDQQRASAHILAFWNIAIEKTERLIEAKEMRKRDLAHKLLFGKARTGKRKTSGFLERPWFLIPNDWRIAKIGSVAEEVSIKNQHGSIPVLSCTKYQGLVDSLKYFEKQIFSEDTSTYKVVEFGQFAYATNHIEEGSIGYQDLYPKGLVSPMYTVFKTDQNLVNDGYLYKLLKTETFRHIFEINTSASVDRRGSLRWTEFSMLPVPLPSVAEQTEINEVLDIAQREIDLLRGEIDLLSKQKRGLMQKLLTGQWRVGVDNNVE